MLKPSQMMTSLRDFVVGFSVSCLSYALWACRTEGVVHGSPLLVGVLTSTEGLIDMWVLWRIVAKKKFAFAAGCILGMGTGAAFGVLWSK